MLNHPERKEIYGEPSRASFPDDENRYSWLPLLLDAYLIVDQGITLSITREQEKGRKIACSIGCSVCCRFQEHIPVYPLELVGITWYAIEKVRGEKREVLKKELRAYESKGPCPFVIDNVCSIYPLRPMACRQFIAFTRPCAEGEDPVHTRRDDMLIPDRESIHHAFFRMLPFYGVEDESERLEVIESGAIQRMVSLLSEGKWKGLAERMDAFDRER